MPTKRTSSTYSIRLADVLPYSPANHKGTVHRRLISQETVGAKNIEVLIAEITKDKGALPHAHPGIEQVCYQLEGKTIAEVDGQTRELGPGDCCYFPADFAHVFTAISDSPVKVLEVYSPPYGEDPAKVVR
jgi:mannose-6-phosphate isomerase-like protein (cupin superfamily)